MKKVKSLLLAMALLSLHNAQANNWLPNETHLASPNNDKKGTQSDPLIIIADPIASAINIRFVALKDETYVVHLISASGNEISRQYRFLSEGVNSIEIKTQNIPIGTYHIKIDNEFQSEMGKLWVQK